MASKSKIISLSFIAAVSLLLAGCSNQLGDKYVNFAQCLADKGAKMYGAYWCPHCENQKNMFDKKAFEKVPYIECDPRGENANPAACQEQKIKGYPTWIFSDGTRVEGEQSLESLAKKTACELPKEEKN